MAEDWNVPIRYLKGVGDRRAALFARLGVTDVRTLLRHFPRGYEDWATVVPVAQAPAGELCCVCVTALTPPQERRIRQGMVLYTFVAADDSGEVQVTLFNNRYAAAMVKRGGKYRLYGTLTLNFLRREMTSPQIESAAHPPRIRPVYPQTEGLTSRVIEAAVRAALDRTGDALEQETLPEPLRRELELCGRRQALENIHFPSDHAALEQARRRLVFEDLLVLQLGLLRLKGRTRQQSGAVMTDDNTEEFWKLLPFSPTGAQRRAVAECVHDMRGTAPMSRLIQGDVGSGKTAVAAGVAYHAIRNGWQAAMMAPTEILAEQHVRSLSALLEPGGIRVGLLTGAMSAAGKRETLNALEAGTLDLVVGTHALLSEGVRFHRLGLVITDEQHRFGVAQRATLAAKGENPHLLVMSATPIPRTLALMVYGDLDVSVLDELPPGRQPVATYAIDSSKRERAYAYVRRHLDEGRQAYVVCPLVEEGEGDLASATAYARELQDGALRGYSLGLLHGKLKAAEKERVMTAFSRNELSVLVATTVIEVGVDVPNAVLMVIENAERFGLAQLHQLRGRVGRGRYASSCILISDAQNEEARRRLRVMCETNDGFRIADEDLKLRGPGDFFGNRQHGLPELHIADLMGDMAILHTAQDAARELSAHDPSLKAPEHCLLAEEVRLLFERVGEQGLN